jgi:hypothetical protein
MIFYINQHDYFLSNLPAVGRGSLPESQPDRNGLVGIRSGGHVTVEKLNINT